MMWWDRLAGTYKAPESLRHFNHNPETNVQGSSLNTIDTGQKVPGFSVAPDDKPRAEMDVLDGKLGKDA